MKVRAVIAILAIAVLAIGLSGCFQTTGPLAKIAASTTEDYPPFDVTFDASGSSSPNSTIVSYDWNFGDGETGNAKIEEHTYYEKGSYDVTLVITNSDAETATAVKVVTAKNYPPTAVFTVIPLQVQANQSVRFEAYLSVDPDGDIVQYIWSFGDGSTDEGEVVKHAYIESGEPQVTLAVIDDDGAMATATKSVTVVSCCGQP